MAPEHERRSSRRLEVSLEGYWHGPSGRQPVRIINLSQGGCLVATTTSPSEGERIRLVVHLSPFASLTTEARVAHSGPRGFGAEFVNMNDDQRRILRDAYDELSRTQEMGADSESRS